MRFRFDPNKNVLQAHCGRQPTYNLELPSKKMSRPNKIQAKLSYSSFYLNIIMFTRSQLRRTKQTQTSADD